MISSDSRKPTVTFHSHSLSLTNCRLASSTSEDKAVVCEPMIKFYAEELRKSIDLSQNAHRRTRVELRQHGSVSMDLRLRRGFLSLTLVLRLAPGGRAWPTPPGAFSLRFCVGNSAA